MRVDLDKEECQFLSSAMSEALIQVDEEIGRVARTATAEEKAETQHIRDVFYGIKVKMDCAMGES